MSELIKFDNNQLQASEELKSLFIKQQEIEAVQKQLDKQMKTFKKELIGAMKEHGISKAEIFLNEDESVFLTYTAPTTRTSIDSEKLKEDGLYEFYLKESDVKESLRIRIGERKGDE